MRKITGFMFWVLFGLGIVIIPIACATDNNGNDASGTGGSSSHVDMAGKGDALTKT
ncbi:MAG TPA: hypothetical protein VGP64_06005 [Polyangia bacterium]|jgi:hypothetical protein